MAHRLEQFFGSDWVQRYRYAPTIIFLLVFHNIGGLLCSGLTGFRDFHAKRDPSSITNNTPVGFLVCFGLVLVVFGLGLALCRMQTYNQGRRLRDTIMLSVGFMLMAISLWKKLEPHGLNHLMIGMLAIPIANVIHDFERRTGVIAHNIVIAGFLFIFAAGLSPLWIWLFSADYLHNIDQNVRSNIMSVEIFAYCAVAIDAYIGLCWVGFMTSPFAFKGSPYRGFFASKPQGEDSLHFFMTGLLSVVWTSVVLLGQVNVFQKLLIPFLSNFVDNVPAVLLVLIVIAIHLALARQFAHRQRQNEQQPPF